MISVLHIITRLDMGGSAQNTLKTCIGLSDEDYRIVLVSGTSVESQMTPAERSVVNSEAEFAKTSGVKILILSTLIRRIDPLMDILALIGLICFIRREGPQIVHTHTSKAGILGRLAAWLMRVPVIVHTPHGHVFHGHFSKLLSQIFLIIERVFDKITDCTVALTDGERNDYIDKSVSRSDRLVKIHSGVDVQRFKKPAENIQRKRIALGIDPSEMVIGTVGWLLPIKGPTFLLEAMQRVWRKHSNIKLMFVGKGDLEPVLKEQAFGMGAKGRVLFPGWRDDIPDMMHLMDIFVLPSLNEGMGRVIVEAMAAGIPVVASKTGGIPDLVNEGETGFLVAPADSEALANAILKLVADSDLRRSMGQKGQERCHLFSEELMVKKGNYIQFYPKIT